MADISMIVYWHWLILACALMIVEIFAPGFFLIWIGIAAAVVGGITFLFPNIPFEWQIILISVLSLVIIIGWRQWRKANPDPEPDVQLNRRGESYIGSSFKLETAIENGRGRMRIGDTIWRVEGPDLPAGSKVKVVNVKTTTLIVEEK